MGESFCSYVDSTCTEIITTNSLVFLPDKPLEGSGSLSDWMGRAGDLSREADPVCSHAQLSTHSKERSARGTSIPNLPLVFLSLSAKIFPRKLPIWRTLGSHCRLKRLISNRVIKKTQVSSLHPSVGLSVVGRSPVFNHPRFSQAEGFRRQHTAYRTVRLSSVPAVSSGSRPFLFYSLLP